MSAQMRRRALRRWWALVSVTAVTLVAVIAVSVQPPPATTVAQPVRLTRPQPTSAGNTTLPAVRAPRPGTDAPPDTGSAAVNRHVVQRNRLISADGRVDTAVGVYSDCRGVTPLRHDEAAIDTCVGGRVYFVGHTPGVFSGLAAEPVGAIIRWWDDAARAHVLRVIARLRWPRYSNGGVAPAASGTTAEFQTCITGTLTAELILDAVQIA